MKKGIVSLIKAILFDIDNTLLDFDGYVKESLKEGFAEFGLGEYNDGVYRVFEEINTELWHRIELGTLSYEELMRIRWNTVFSALGIEYDGVKFEKYFKGRLFDSGIKVKGAEEILEYLSGRYILAAASNGPYLQQENRLRISGLDRFFSHVFVSESIGYSKPKKEFFEHCAEALNKYAAKPLLPCEIMMIGDSLTSDIRGAKDMGYLTCYFDKRGIGDPENITPDYVIKELSRLKEIL